MTENGGGAVIHIASVSGMGVDDPAYGSLKAALIALGRNQAEQLLGSGIRVNVVAPGSIEFPGGFWDDVRRDDPALYADVLAGSPAGRLGRPEEVAAAVVFLASPVASWVAGSLLRVDGAQFKGNR
jgi:3-oxoacyl-[acyl-carrier protein] reductase